MIDYNATPEELKQQILDLAKLASSGNAEAGAEIVEYCTYCLRDHKRQLGTKKGRDTNLRRAIRLSIADLNEKGLELTDDKITGNLWLINHGLNEFQQIIQEIIPGRTKADSFVYWIDQKGIERKSDFNSVHKVINNVQFLDSSRS